MRNKRMIINFVDRLDEKFQPIDLDNIKHIVEDALEEDYEISIVNVIVEDVNEDVV